MIISSCLLRNILPPPWHKAINMTVLVIFVICYHIDSLSPIINITNSIQMIYKGSSRAIPSYRLQILPDCAFDVYLSLFLSKILSSILMEIFFFIKLYSYNHTRCCSSSVTRSQKFISHLIKKNAC